MIRDLTPQDAAEAAALHALCFPKGWPAEDFARYANDPGVVARGVVRDGALAGVLIATLVAGEAEILSIMVHPAHRRAGLGLALLQDMAELGADRWTLEVATDNVAAVRLYHRFGCVRVRRRPAYYANGVDAWVMVGPAWALD